MEMTEVNLTGEAELEADEGAGESGVMSALRKELKKSNKLNADLTTERDSIAEQTRLEIKRGQDALAIVNALGYPGMAVDYASQVEGDLTEESAVAFLQGKGLEPRSLEAAPEVVVETLPVNLAESLAATTDLGSRLADASSGAGATGAAQRTEALIDKAESAEEIQAIMAAAGLLN